MAVRAHTTQPSRRRAMARSAADKKAHWEEVYAARGPAEMSWHQADPRLSLALIDATGAGSDASLIDVGGGASTLVDHLLDAGHRSITVLDIAEGAIQQARARLGERADTVTWLVQDISAGLPGRHYDIWHDRAVFHFLTDAGDRRRYLAALRQALRPGGHLILATFAPDGPTQCSGLRVMRYSRESLSETLGGHFRLVESLAEAHRTPRGALQHFVYCRYTRNAAAMRV
jgi:SAM-dependent methyltransferase